MTTPTMATAFSIEEVLALAEQIERDGERFYQGAAWRCTDLRGKEALEHLARWEGSHQTVLRGLRERIRSAQDPRSRDFDPEGTAERYVIAALDGHVFRAVGGPQDLLRATDGPRAIFELALRFERDSIAFLEALSPLLVGEIAGSIAELIAEEREHVTYLERVLAYGNWS